MCVSTPSHSAFFSAFLAFFSAASQQPPSHSKKGYPTKTTEATHLVRQHALMLCLLFGILGLFLSSKPAASLSLQKIATLPKPLQHRKRQHRKRQHALTLYLLFGILGLLLSSKPAASLSLQKRLPYQNHRSNTPCASARPHTLPPSWQSWPAFQQEASTPPLTPKKATLPKPLSTLCFSTPSHSAFLSAFFSAGSQHSPLTPKKSHPARSYQNLQEPTRTYQNLPEPQKRRTLCVSTTSRSAFFSACFSAGVRYLRRLTKIIHPTRTTEATHLVRQHALTLCLLFGLLLSRSQVPAPFNQNNPPYQNHKSNAPCASARPHALPSFRPASQQESGTCVVSPLSASPLRGCDCCGR